MAVVVDEQQLGSSLFHAALILVVELVAVYDDPFRTAGMCQLPNSCSVLATACGDFQAYDLNVLGAKASLDRRGRPRHGIHNVTTCILPSLRKTQAAHHMAGAHGYACVSANKKSTGRQSVSMQRFLQHA